MEILAHLFMHMFGTISKSAINESAWLGKNMNGHYSLNGNGCNLQIEIVVYDD
jgi:hypothetical protein